jgi:hypothetical protein
MGDYVSFMYSAPVEVRIQGKVSIGTGSDVRPASGSVPVPHDVMFYIGGINGTTGGLTETPKAVQTGTSVTLKANWYVPNGTMSVAYGSDIIGGIVAKDILTGNSVTFNVDSYFSTDTTMAKLSASQNEVSASAVPERFALHQNHPNPFNPVTTFRFDLPTTAQVRLTVYNALGQKVAMVIDGVWDAGAHSVSWDASRFSSGIYFYTLEAEEKFRMTRKLLLMK